MTFREYVYRNIVEEFKRPRETRDAFKGLMYAIAYEGIYNAGGACNYAIHCTRPEGNIVMSLREETDYNSNKFYEVDTSKTVIKFRECEDVLVIPEEESTYWIAGVGDVKFITCVNACQKGARAFRIELVTNDIERFKKNYEHCIIKKDKQSDKSEFGIACYSDGTLYANYYDLKKKYDTNIELNYNDDIPWNEINERIEDDTCADLILLYGKPGTGKSSIIKKLISEHDNKDFIFLDGSLLANVQPSAFVSWLSENENLVLILEDCEKVLERRSTSLHGGVMSTILNITDGVISDILGIKLICTFNTSINNIDEALLRKGRLSIKYEFKELSLDKTKKLLPSATVPMTLADIYNEKENDFSKKKTNKIGF